MYAPGKSEEVFTNNNGNILPYNEFRINETDREHSQVVRWPKARQPAEKRGHPPDY